MSRFARLDLLRLAAALAGTLGLAAPFCGCDGSASLEELNRVVPVPDPTADDTAADAPFRPGQRRDVGDADAIFELDDASHDVQGALMPGDLDGDGVDDLVIWGVHRTGAEIVPCHRGCPGFEQGEVHVVYGGASLGGLGALRPDATIRTWYVNGLSFTVDAAGDVDGDGRAELVVGVGREGECGQGNVHVVGGGARLRGVHDLRDVGALIREEGSCTELDRPAGLGDIDGDGLDDLAIGAPAAPGGGRLYLFYGDRSAPPARRSEADASGWLEHDGGERLGLAARAGDVDGDGLADFLVHADERGGAREHAWWLVRGRDARFTGGAEISAIATRLDATTVRPAGDLDGDGHDDLVVTGAASLPDAVVIWGRSEWPSSLDVSQADTWVDDGEDGRASVITPRQGLAAGDVDGDGHADFFYADPAYGEGAPRGAVYLFRGPLARASGPLALTGASALLGQDWFSELQPDMRRGYDSIGRSIAAGSDVNGDGIDDVLLVAAQAPDGGRAYLWLGRAE